VRALDLVLGQVAHDRQRLIARSRSVRQLNAFLVRQEALAEPEMEKKWRGMAHVLSIDLAVVQWQTSISFKRGNHTKHTPNSVRRIKK
jgi:hypothetical protein